MFLTAEELVELTGYVQAAAQARELQHLAIPYRRRRDGRVLVLTEDVRPAKTASTAASERRPQLRLS